MPRSLALLFVISGAVAVGFEILWAKQLARVLGGSTSSIAFVVAVFMGGMGTGYAIGGRVAARLRRPAVAYGLAEVGIAVFGLATVYFVPSLEGQLSRPAAFASSAALLLPTAILAGFTLPVLVEATTGTVGRALGRLYALNTGGAVVGVSCTGLYLVGALGLRGTAWALASAGLGVGLIAIVVGRALPAREPTASGAHAPPSGSRAWLVLAAVAGMASLAEEVLWSRALLAHFNSSTYALAVILAVFLLGIAIGSAVAAGFLRRERERSATALLVASQVGAGFLVLISPELLVVAELVLPGYVGVSEVGARSTWLATVGLGLARTSLVLLPPTILIGFALPLLGELHAGGDRDARGRAAGRITAANTVGGIAGALTARFVLLPWVGLDGGLRAAVALHVLVAVAALLASREARRPAGSVRLWLAVPACLAIALVVRPTSAPFVGRLAADQELLFVDEGVQDTTAVVERLDGARHLFSNGIAYASDGEVGRRYMGLLGHLPALRARDRSRALVVCVGTGITAAAVARHPFEHLDVVDISPVVHRTLPLFARSNDRFFDDPRVSIHVADGRLFSARQPPGTYDVVTLEPPPPRAAGVASLYSIEFYLHARALLRDGGAIAQWLPLHGMTRGELDLLTRTFFEVFPRGSIVQLHPVEAALVATRGRGADRATRARRAAEPRIREQLDAIGVDDPDLLPTAPADAVRRAIGSGPVVTDDHPRIEQFAAMLGEDDDIDDARDRFLRAMEL